MNKDAELNPEEQASETAAEAAAETVKAAETGEAAEAAAAEAETEADPADGEFDVEDYLRQFKELEAEKDKLAAEKEQLDARLLRLQADFDNFRRRSRTDAEEAGRKAASGLAEGLLPVLDNFERALAAMEDSADRQGVEMIMKQLFTVLNGAGLEEIAAEGAEFDPKLHHAVSQLDAGEEQKNKVVAVLQKGYTFGGRLLRAPMVQVGV